jgi:hypothetical protein
MKIRCPNCDQFFKSGEIVKAVVFSPCVDIPSRISFCIAKPIGIDQDSLEHKDCKKENEQ